MHSRVNESNFPSLKDVTSSEAFDEARAIRETIDTPGWGLVVKLVAEAKEFHVHYLTADHHEYAEMARRGGIVEGLNVLNAAVSAVLDRDERVREDLDKLAGSEQEA